MRKLDQILPIGIVYDRGDTVEIRREDLNELIEFAKSVPSEREPIHAASAERVAQHAAIREESTPCASTLSSDKEQKEFIATMAREYGPEAGEAVADFLRAHLSARGERVARDEALMEAASIVDSYGYNVISERIRALVGTSYVK